MSPFLSISLLLLTALVAAAPSVTTSSQFIKLTSGDSIPLTAVSAHFHSDPDTDISKQLYEINDSFLLSGHDRALSLNDLTLARGVISDHVPSVTVNGIRREKVTADGFVRSGNGYTVAHMGDGRVVGVWGNGLSLQPVDYANYPGLFINSHKLEEGDLKMNADVMYPEKSVSNGDFEVQEASFDTDTEDSLSSVASQETKCGSPPVLKIVEVAVTFDSQFCAQHGHDEVAAVIAIGAAFKVAGEPYENQTCIRLKVVNIEAHCEDPDDPFEGFSRKLTGDLLGDFRNMWANTRTSLHRDIAVYIPGYRIKTATSGVAWVGGACLEESGYAWAILEPLVLAHEIGHLLNGKHVKRGLMKKSWNSGDKLFFSRKSLREINNFIDKVPSASCIQEDDTMTTQPPPATTTTTTAVVGATSTKGTGTPAVTTIPTTLPPSLGSTCGDFFTREHALDCSRKKTIISNGGKQKIGKTRAVLSQENGQFKLRFSGIKEIRIESFSHLLSFDGDLEIGDLPPIMDYPAKGRKNLRKVWDIGVLQAPQAGETCCDKTVHLYVLITHCNPFIQKCSSIFFTATSNVECSVCATGIFEPMSSSRKCPSCDGS